MPFLCGLPVNGDGHVIPLHKGFRDAPADDSEIGAAEVAVPDLQRAARAIGYRMLCSPSFERDRGSHSAGVA
eukprot:2170738-Pyramimonas_sp.AAC.1